MNVAVTLHFASLEEAMAFLDGGRPVASPAKTVTVVDAPAPERRKTRSKKAEDEFTALPPKDAPVETPPVGDEVPTPEPLGASEESAKEAIHAFANAHGVPAAKALLAEFGVARTSELTDPLKRYELIVRVSKELK